MNTARRTPQSPQHLPARDFREPSLPSGFARVAMYRLLPGLAAALLMVSAQAQPAASDAAAPTGDEAFYERAATCAAAMETDQRALVVRARAGTSGLRPELVHLTQLGFAYVGSAYKRGLRNPRADQMLKDAHQQQKDWDAARHAKTVAECRVEGQALYDDATSLEQWLVTKRANSRVDKFLAPPPPASPPDSGASR